MRWLLLTVCGGLVGLTEMGEGAGLLVPVAEFVEHVHGVPVTGARLPVVAEVVVDVAEAVRCLGGTAPVADLLQQDQGTLALGQGPPVVAEHGVAPADRVERVGLRGAVTGDPGQP